MGDREGRWWIVWMRRVGRIDWIEEIALRGPGRRGSDAIAVVVLLVEWCGVVKKKLRRKPKWRRKSRLRLSDLQLSAICTCQLHQPKRSTDVFSILSTADRHKIPFLARGGKHGE